VRDDSVRIFQRLAQLELDIRRYGPSEKRSLQKAMYCLALGDPDKAIDAVQDLIDRKKGSQEPVVIREAVWLGTLAMCLKVAILEGDVEGAPHLSLPPKTEIPRLRATARDLLLRIPDLDADETRVLRKLKGGERLDFIEELVYLRAD